MDTPATDEEFNAKIAEVVGNLGVAVATAFRKQSSTGDPDGMGHVRELWETLGRSFAELIAMEPPR